MNIKEFVVKSQETMIYRNDDVKAHCLFAGIIEEWAEVKEELEAYLGPNPTDKTDLLGELGDFCFKVYNLGYHFGYIDFEYVHEERLIVDIFPILAKVSKKTARDTNGMMVDPARIQVFKYCMDILHSFIIDICNGYEYNLSDVLFYNVEKLQDRLERGVIMGDGSNR